ncbi:hypothetical protein scyTo_0012574 [Scyliorhinus torazame]|uniref:Uncharacterized protein n=1 Tax=Scyliorhinus torazame TaxID=75743 RepID=A0A401PAT4_SCYTO|nr:hypothetical protein [Scyliorhinus torazame]
MPFFGRLDAFDLTIEDWSQYVERMCYFFQANKIMKDEKKLVILLSACGPSAFAIIRSLTYPNMLDMIPFQELTELMEKHYDPKPPLILRRYRFYTTKREDRVSHKFLDLPEKAGGKM